MKKLIIIIIMLLIIVLGISNSTPIDNKPHNNTTTQPVIAPKHIKTFIENNYDITYTPISDTSVNINISGYNKDQTIHTSIDINCDDNHNIQVFYTSIVDDEFSRNSVPVYDDTNHYKVYDKDINSFEYFLRDLSMFFDPFIKECKEYINTYQSFAKRSSIDTYSYPILIYNQADYQNAVIDLFNTFKSQYDNEVIAIECNKNYIIKTQFSFYLKDKYNEQEALTYCNQLTNDFLTQISRIKFNSTEFLGKDNYIDIYTYYLTCNKNHKHARTCFKRSGFNEITITTKKTTVETIK